MFFSWKAWVKRKMEGQRQLRSIGSVQEVPGAIVRGSLPLISNPAGIVSNFFHYYAYFLRFELTRPDYS